MDSLFDYYAMLGIPSTSGEDAIRQAYRALARRFHPDTNKAAGATVLFQNINTAYETLADAAQRSQYDVAYQRLQAKGPLLSQHIHLSRSNLRPLAEPQLVYALIKIQPALQHKFNADAPLNLCLVVDRSKSMAGTRMQHVKTAAYRIIDDCRPTDMFSMVVFSDNAEVIIPAQHPEDMRALKAMVSTIRADGATAMLAGLREGVGQIKRHLASQYVNHLILITDGRTYGDETDCIQLAEKARRDGIGISGMGIGDDWNDRFLDDLASRTGGSTAYISSADTVNQFLQGRVRSLASAYAERSRLLIVPDPQVELHSVVRLSPSAMMLSADTQPISLGVVDATSPTTLMVQFHVSTQDAQPGTLSIGRIDFEADVLGSTHQAERISYDITVNITQEDVAEEPSPDILEALSKLMLYRLQDRAREAIDQGNISLATRSLEYLATRLFETGEEDLGQAALQEARHITQTQNLSDEGAKRLKYGTRALMPLSGAKNG